MKTTLNKKSKLVPALACVILTLLCLSTLAMAGETSPIVADGNRPAEATSDPINEQTREIGRVEVSASPDGRYFENMTENSNHTEAALVFVDSWGTEDLAGIGREFLVELYISKYDSDKDLNLTGYYWDDESGIESIENFTDPINVASGVLNASIWASKFGGDDWKIVVAGTYQPGAAISGFCALYTYTGAAFVLEDFDGERQMNGMETYFTDMVIFDYDNDTSREIVICGYHNHTDGIYDAQLWIFNTTGVALTTEHILSWGETTTSTKPTALMYGQLCNDSLMELAVVGYGDDEAGETRARLDAFWGNETHWAEPGETMAFPFGEGDNSSFHDVAVGDYDGSKTNQTMIVGQMGLTGVISGINWTGCALCVDVYGPFGYAGADYTRLYEVEIADSCPDPPQSVSWGSQEVTTAGLIGDDVEGEKLVVSVWNFSDGGFLWNHTSSDYFVQVFPWMELMLTDWTNDDEPEITLGWTLENSILAVETVYDIGLYTPPASVPEQEPTSEPEEEAGRKPHSVKKADVAPWEADPHDSYPYVIDPAAFLELHGMHLVYLLVVSGILVASVLVGWKLLGPYVLLAALASLGVTFLLASFTTLMDPFISLVESVWQHGWGSVGTWWSLVADFWTNWGVGWLAFWNSYDWMWSSGVAYLEMVSENWFNVNLLGYYNWCDYWEGLWVYYGAYVDGMIV